MTSHPEHDLTAAVIMPGGFARPGGGVPRVNGWLVGSASAAVRAQVGVNGGAVSVDCVFGAYMRAELCPCTTPSLQTPRIPCATLPLVPLRSIYPRDGVETPGVPVRRRTFNSPFPPMSQRAALRASVDFGIAFAASVAEIYVLARARATAIGDSAL